MTFATECTFTIKQARSYLCHLVCAVLGAEHLDCDSVKKPVAVAGTMQPSRVGDRGGGEQYRSDSEGDGLTVHGMV